MKILVTGAKGFIGKNLIVTLNNINAGKDKTFGLFEEIIIYEYDIDTNPALLDVYCKDCNFVFHLAGINRPKEQSEFMTGNYGFTSKLLNTLKKYKNISPIMISSSIQAELDNPYGWSKKAGEDLIFSYGEETGAKIYAYRYPNVFGKWCRPNYNSAVATFCYNIAHDLPIQVNDPSVIMNLVYIDDVVMELIAALNDNVHINEEGFCVVPVVHTITLGEIVKLLYSFRDSRNTLSIPDMTEDGFVKKLYATYLSYLPTEQFSYPLKMNVDERGSFTEILRTSDRGQFSVNISKPGITKGEHWHHTKNEKFVVVSGKGVIQLRRIDSDEIIEYHVSGEKIEVVDIPTGYTHNIINEGDTDLITFMWCSECFNSQKPDTYFLKVDEKRKGID
ncbi:MAG: capsular polysaccharide biosynthesis protein CapF [Lachnospiraceae bacterium]|jgi:Nucleoside-diphosphate-sugar epimerases|nr:capsular polysaccharide biosynthesis protein CapF [Lachnospiraceae bacterium]